MSIKYSIAGYCRISVDEEMDRDNTSIENQKAIIADFVKRKFPDSTLDFYEDRDRSGYTFEQREGYQELRKKMLRSEYDILIVKDFSRFSRRNSKLIGGKGRVLIGGTWGMSDWCVWGL